MYPDTKAIVSGFFAPLDPTRCLVCGKELRNGDVRDTKRLTRLAGCQIRKIIKMNAQEFVNSIEFPCFFFSGNGAPAGQTYAILENTALPVDLDDVEGEIEADGGFICTNHDDGKGGWNHSDSQGNTITKIKIYSDEKLWNQEQAEYLADC